jgi:transposase
MTFAKTPFKLKLAMPDILENAEANLTPRMRNLVSLLWSEWKDLEQQIVGMNQEIEQIASSDPACQRLRQIPGIGPLVATAIVAAIGNGAAFHKGREFSSWLGLVPRQHSTEYPVGQCIERCQRSDRTSHPQGHSGGRTRSA